MTPAAVTRAITACSLGVSAALVGLKLWAWLASGSVAVLASLADSSLDLVASMATFWAVRYAAAPPDAEHRYGHGKAEAFAGLVQAGLVFASAALIGQEAITHLVNPQTLHSESLALGVMVVSLIATGGLVIGQTWALRRIRSVAVEADRTHFFADLASNIAALLGVAAAAWLHWRAFDPVAGLVVAALLLWGAIKVFRGASTELLDRELPGEDRAQIRRILREAEGVRGVHELRTRASGPRIHIQAHVDVDPELSLVDAHKIIVRAEAQLLETFPRADVLIHPDPRGRAEPHGGDFSEIHEHD